MTIKKQGTFKFAIKRLEKIVTENLNGTLNLEDCYTDIVIDSAQGSAISTISNMVHLKNGQHITIRNKVATNIFLDASLMANGSSIDIEPDTVCILGVYGSKFIPLGGTSEVKDVEELLYSHKHGENGYPKLNPLNSLDSTNVTEMASLRLVNGSWTYYDSNELSEHNVIASRLFS
jgi:hypothetical protein